MSTPGDERDAETPEPTESPAPAAAAPAAAPAPAAPPAAAPAPAAPPAAAPAPAAPAPAAPPPDAATGSAGPRTIPPTPDIAVVEGDTVLPGGHRGGFRRLPTAPVEVVSQSAPSDPDGEHEPDVRWAFPEQAEPRRGLAGWALAFSILGLSASLFVGWGFPLGAVGIVSGVLALRRPLESRTMAVWAIVLGGVSIVYSAGWLILAAARANLFG